MRFGMFVLASLLLSALIIAWRVAPDDDKRPIRAAVHRHWWVVALTIGALFGVAAGMSLTSWRLF